MGLPVEVRPTNLEEDFSELPPVEDTLRLAEDKLKAYISGTELTNSGFILAADTIVAMEGRKIGKPEDRDEAREFLRLFSGKTHQVVSGLALFSPAKGITLESAVTDVTFSQLSEPEIEWYLDTKEWEGVAAGYRIQESGSRFIANLSGSYSNVMGLPIFTFYGMLQAHNYPFYKE